MCFIFTKVVLQGKASYFSMPVDILEGSKILKSGRATCTYERIFLKVVALFSYIKPYFHFSILHKT